MKLFIMLVIHSTGLPPNFTNEIPGYSRLFFIRFCFQVFPGSVRQIPAYHLESCNIDNATILVIFQMFR